MGLFPILLHCICLATSQSTVMRNKNCDLHRAFQHSDTLICHLPVSAHFHLGKKIQPFPRFAKEKRQKLQVVKLSRATWYVMRLGWNLARKVQAEQLHLQEHKITMRSMSNWRKLTLRSAKCGSYSTTAHSKHTWSLSINTFSIINQVLVLLASFSQQNCTR